MEEIEITDGQILVYGVFKYLVMGKQGIIRLVPLRADFHNCGCGDTEN